MESSPHPVVVETDALAAAPWYRREPYRLFFPLGIVLAWVGIGPWLAFSVGLSVRFDPVFHSITQIQGFLMAFAVGFLMTMIPRRTGTAPPAAAEIVGCAAALIAIVGFAHAQLWAWSQLAWLALAAIVIHFAVRRFVSAGARRRPPNAFVWIPLSLLIGVLGSLMTAFGAAQGGELFWLHDVGRGLVLQGMFIGLVLGVGTLAFPLMTRGQAPADAKPGGTDRAARLAHATAALVLAASFFVEHAGYARGAYLLRTAVIAAVLVGAIELWRPPDQPGANRWWIWAAGWCLPLGYAAAFAWPDRASAGLHVSFVAGFALLALAVGTQVSLGHGGYRELMLGRPAAVTAVGLLMTVATLARVLMIADASRYYAWMGIASAAFLGATAVWLAFLVPKMTRPRPTPT